MHNNGRYTQNHTFTNSVAHVPIISSNHCLTPPDPWCCSVGVWPNTPSVSIGCNSGNTPDHFIWGTPTFRRRDVIILHRFPSRWNSGGVLTVLDDGDRAYDVQKVRTSSNWPIYNYQFRVSQTGHSLRTSHKGGASVSCWSPCFVLLLSPAMSV
jgi:hypothetical protein